MTHFVVIFGLAIISFTRFEHNLLNVQAEDDSNWSLADGTWYGSANGAGSDGGACGYTNSVEQAPFSSFISAGGPSLYKSGKGCGACYEVKCTKNVACSGKAVVVVITDEAPGGISTPNATHFDLSGTAFGAMANPGQADKLRNAGQLQIEYRRTGCNYPKVSPTFHIDSGSNDEYFATLIQYVSGDGELNAVYLKEASQGSWLAMQRSWGAVWKLQSSYKLNAPFSFKLIDDANKTLLAENVIPASWVTGKSYKASATAFV